MPLYFARAYAAAERAFRFATCLDPAAAGAHLGLSWIAARRRRWAESENRARTSLALEPGSVDAHRALARSLEKQNRLDEAIRAYEQSLKLALAGARPFNAVIATDPGGGRLLDSDHARTHALLARLYQRKGDDQRAITGYRIAIAGGYNPPLLRTRLTRLYSRQRRSDDAQRRTTTGMKNTSNAIPAAAVRTRQRVRAIAKSEVTYR
jgi:tetratricopeptide (TPR) repeat protein